MKKNIHAVTKPRDINQPIQSIQISAIYIKLYGITKAIEIKLYGMYKNLYINNYIVYTFSIKVFSVCKTKVMLSIMQVFAFIIVVTCWSETSAPCIYISISIPISISTYIYILSACCPARCCTAIL